MPNLRDDFSLCKEAPMQHTGNIVILLKNRLKLPRENCFKHAMIAPRFRLFLSEMAIACKETLTKPNGKSDAKTVLIQLHKRSNKIGINLEGKIKCLI